MFMADVFLGKGLNLIDRYNAHGIVFCTLQAVVLVVDLLVKADASISGNTLPALIVFVSEKPGTGLSEVDK